MTALFNGQTSIAKQIGKEHFDDKLIAIVRAGKLSQWLFDDDDNDDYTPNRSVCIHHHRLICKQKLKQTITTVQYVKDSRYNQGETAPTVALYNKHEHWTAEN